jgi:hypothetical protein
MAHLKPPVPPFKALNGISPLPRISVNKGTKKQEATVLATSEFIKSTQELKEAKAEGGKRKMEGGPQTSNMNQKRQSFTLEKTVGNPEVDSHSCAECWENCYTTRRKDGWT